MVCSTSQSPLAVADSPPSLTHNIITHFRLLPSLKSWILLPLTVLSRVTGALGTLNPFNSQRDLWHGGLRQRWMFCCKSCWDNSKVQVCTARMFLKRCHTLPMQQDTTQNSGHLKQVCVYITLKYGAAVWNYTSFNKEKAHEMKIKKSDFG